jgi:hypothetical protein
LWRNDGQAPFTETAFEEGLVDDRSGRALMTLDFNNDGALDVLVVNNAGTPTLFQNNAPSSDASWLRVQVEGADNRFGVGAIVEVEAEAGGAVQRRDVRAGAVFLGGSHPEVHFGFGPWGSPLYEVRVTFPATGLVAVVAQVDPNQILVVPEP